tara:strand:+ start:276 stop:1022 length:747 start_codon:yes stop_codon:yes gene_type:complete
MAHALLSPSASNIWLKCPGMPNLAKDIPYQVSEAAANGTLVHQMVEAQLKDRLNNITLEDYYLGKEENIENIKILIDQSMIDCAKTYVDYVRQRQKELKGKLLIEERVSIEEISQNVWGTADAIIIGKNRLVVCDLKSGKFPVDPKNNTQLMIYGLGALSRYGNEDTTLELTIVQPRSFSPDGPIRSWDISAADLVDWGFGFLKEATVACEREKPKLIFGNHCRFCVAKANCPAYKDATKGEKNVGKI